VKSPGGNFSTQKESKDQYKKYHHSIREGQKDPGPDTMCPEEVWHAHQCEGAEKGGCKRHETYHQANVRTGKNKVLRPFCPSSCPDSQESKHGDIENSKY